MTRPCIILPLYLRENSPASFTCEDNCNTAIMGFLSGSKDEHQGRQINSYNIFVLLLLGVGSITYGYSASIIATTLGKFHLVRHNEGYVLMTCRTTVFSQVLRNRNSTRRFESGVLHQWTFLRWWCHRTAFASMGCGQVW